MSFEVIEEYTEVKSGGHTTSLVRCKCGNEFYIQKRRINTQKNCIKCSYKSTANLGHEKIARRNQENEKLKKALEVADDHLRSISFLKEGFAEDLGNCIDLADQALKEIEEVLK